MGRRRRLVRSDEMEAATLNQDSATAEEVEWSWKREALQTGKARTTIILYSRRAIIQEIAHELELIGDGGVYWDFINSSCFGFLMQYDTQKGFGSLIALSFLLAREVVKADADPDELWFCVGGRFIRFSKYEYALVTGLSFGPTTFDPCAEHEPPAGGLFSRHYLGKRVKVSTLRRDFTNGVFRDSPADALKVAKLLIVYLLLFGWSEEFIYIDKWAWTLIEDSDGWETFIWGKYTYQILLSNLQKICDGTQTYHIKGFVWAFLIWAFEAIPALGIACGAHASSNDVLPRCLRWEFKKITQVNVDGLCDHQVQVQSMLEPSTEEQRQPYWEHIHDDLRSGVCYIPQDYLSKKKKTPVVNLSSRDVSRPQGFKDTPSATKPLKAKKKRKTTHASCRVSNQEKVPDLCVHECDQEDDLRVGQGASSFIGIARPRVQSSNNLQSPAMVCKSRKEDNMNCEPQSSNAAVGLAGRDELIFKLMEKINDLNSKNLETERLMEENNELKRKNMETERLMKEINELKSNKNMETERLMEEINELKMSKNMETERLMGEINDLKSKNMEIEQLLGDKCAHAKIGTGPLFSGEGCFSNTTGNSSDDESVPGSRMNESLASFLEEAAGRKWVFSVEMFMAFRHDEELCMNAVCALYRHQKGQSTNGRGCSRFDSMSVSALAEYLIDGDKELRLTKSVAEVKKERPDVIGQCRKLANENALKLFQICCSADDPFFGRL